MTKFLRVNDMGEAKWGLLDNDSIAILEKAPYLGLEISGKIVSLDERNLLAPAEPSKIICVGLNYGEHIKESQSANAIPEEPVLFIKPSTAIIGPIDKIPCYGNLDRVDYEGELAIVIGKMIFRASEAEARDAIFGYTILNDVTARNLQKKDVQWTRAKSFDGFCPIGPWIVTDIDPTDLKIETRLNDELRQSGRTSEQIWNVFQLTSFISNVMTLLPGDIISTGTPKGVGPVKPGDVVTITIENIGTLSNGVEEA
jgi:2-keto-4-pentenoate hydratase/2-oxohepta-3-ene-1,7-dioic acid hydratase in catechol pathway